jgi:hypothetical protein
MLKLAIGFVVGAIIGVIGTLVFVDIDTRLAHHMGEIELGVKIPDALGRDVDPNEPMQWFSSVETEGVFVVTRHGVKTLRLCCDGTEPKPTP